MLLRHHSFFLLRHPTLELSTSLLILRKRAQTFLLGCLFLRVFFLICFLIIMRWFSLICYSPILLINSLFPSYTIWGLFLWQRTLTIQNILLYDWPISITRDRWFPKYIILYVVYFYSEKPPLEECGQGPIWNYPDRISIIPAQV